MSEDTAFEGDPRDHPGRFETKNLPGGYGPAKTPTDATLSHVSPTHVEYAVQPMRTSEAEQENAANDETDRDGETNTEKAAAAGVETPASPEVAEHQEAAETGQLHTPDTEHDQQNAPA